MQDELAAMEQLSAEALWVIARSTLNRDALALDDLLTERKAAGTLTQRGSNGAPLSPRTPTRWPCARRTPTRCSRAVDISCPHSPRCRFQSHAPPVHLG